MYADDTQVLADLHESSGEAARLVPCLLLIQEWMRRNKLCLNEDKTELLTVAGIRDAIFPAIPWPTSWGTPPVPVEVTRDLGVLISHKLSGEAQAKAMSRSGHFHLTGISRMFPLLEHAQKVKLYQAFVNSRLSYGALSLLGASKRVIAKVQGVQNRAIRLLFALPRRTPLSPWRRKLRWLKIADSIASRVCHLLWKAKHGLGPKYLVSLALPLARRPNPRSCYADRLRPAPCKKASRGGRRLATAGIKIWNTLPQHICSISSYTAFKQAVKQYFLSPPMIVPALVTPAPVNITVTAEVVVPSTLPNSLHVQDQLKSLAANASVFPPIATACIPVNSLTGQQASVFSSLAIPEPSEVLVSPPVSSSSVLSSPKPCWGVSSPPLPKRNNIKLRQLAAKNKARWLRERAASVT